MSKKEFLVRKAKSSELDWLFKNQDLFSEAYQISDGPLRKEWPCFVMVDGKNIIGYRYFEFHEQGGEVHAWVGKTCLKEGYTGKGLGNQLVGHSNRLLHSMKFDELHTHAHNPRAKKFWLRFGYKKVGGVPIDVKGNTKFRLDLKQQRERRK